MPDKSIKIPNNTNNLESKIITFLENKFIPFAYYAYIIAIFSSIALTNIFGWGTFLLVLGLRSYKYFRFKEEFLPKTPLNKVIALIFLINVLAVITSPILSLANAPWFRFVARTRNILLFFYNLIIFQYYLDYKKILRFLMYIAPVFLIFALYDSATGSLILKGRFATHFYWPLRNVFGAYKTYVNYAPIHHIILLASIPFVFIMKKTLHKILFISFLVLEFISLVFSGSRSVALSIPFGLITQGIIFWSIKKKWWKHYALTFLGIITIFVISINTVPRLKQRFSYTKSYIEKGGDKHRHHLWKMNLAIFKDYPLLGVGHHLNYEVRDFYKKYQDKLNVPQDQRHFGLAHNDFIQVLSGTGIIGFILFMIFIYQLIKILISLIKSREKLEEHDLYLTIGIAGAMAALFGNSLVDCPFLNQMANHFIMLAIGLAGILYLKYKNKFMS